LGEGFAVACFGGELPGAINIPRAGNDALFERYGVADRATYVFRPDGHVLARCTGIDAAFAQESIDAVLGYDGKAGIAEGKSVQPESDRLFDALSTLLDRKIGVRAPNSTS
jgi:hypothetical protein